MIFRGAEAIVEKIDWQGLSAVSKIRNKRSYRHPDLEKRLVKERLRSESRIIERLLSGGISVPSIYEVNVDKSQIIMEFIDGITLEKGLRTDNFEEYLVSSAKLLSQIHSSGIVHGDPTTSNFMILDKLYAIDFGLSKLYAIDFGLSNFDDDAESRASDLRVFLESLEAHHSEILGRDIFLAAYSEWSQSKEVLNALEVLELRGRYNLMRG